jgi:hypothetical protein
MPKTTAQKPTIADPQSLYQAMHRRGGLPPDRMVGRYRRQILESLHETHEFGPHLRSRLKARIRFHQIMLDELPQ